VVSIHLAVASGDYHALIAGDPYLPKEAWADNSDRRKKARIPDDIVYRPFYQIALDQIRHATENGLKFDWVTADERYGSVPPFSETLEEMGVAYVLEVRKNVTGWLVRPETWDESSEVPGGAASYRNFPRIAEGAAGPKRVDEFVQHSRIFRAQSWIPYRVKDTENGPEVWEIKSAPFFLNRNDLPSQELVLLAMRNVLDGTEKIFIAWNPAGASAETLLRIAFSRWHVERCFEDDKGRIGMDHFEVRRFLSLKRHIILSMISLLFLSQQLSRRKVGGKKSVPDFMPVERCNEWNAADDSALAACQVSGTLQNF
jgi:SRSO17 transposase